MFITACTYNKEKKIEIRQVHAIFTEKTIGRFSLGNVNNFLGFVVLHTRKKRRREDRKRRRGNKGKETKIKERKKNKITRSKYFFSFFLKLRENYPASEIIKKKLKNNSFETAGGTKKNFFPNF